MRINKNDSALDEKGNILVLTLIILFAVSVIGMTLAMTSSMNLKIAGNQRTTTQALFVAEAGISEAIHRLSIQDPTIVTVDGWTGNIAIGDSKPYDPNWKARIYLTSPASAPASSGSVYSTGTLQSSSTEYLQYSNAGGTEDVLTIEHKWKDRNGDGVRDADEIVLYDPMRTPPENYSSGSPVEIITVTGKTANGERVIEAEVVKKTVIARTLGALYVNRAIRLTGNSRFCGFNHPIDFPLDNKAKKNCVSYHLPSGHLPGVTGTGSQIKTQGSVNLGGDPIPINNSASNPFYSLNEVLAISGPELIGILLNADNTSIVKPLNGVTYINGDAWINSNLSGEGLLYVTGNLKSSGNFVYKGLIYVEGDVMFTGSPLILGSMVVHGTSDFNFGSGDAAVLYSQEAVSQALASAMPVITLSWKER